MAKIPECKKMTCSGFTLIELLVVVSIIAILAAIALPALYSYRAKAFNSAAQTDLRNFRAFMEWYASDHAGYPTL